MRHRDPGDFDGDRACYRPVIYVEEHLESLLAVLEFPEARHKPLRTTNMPLDPRQRMRWRGVERVNEEPKQKARLVRTRPNAARREQTYRALLMEQHERWLGVTRLKMQGTS
ncbi:MAG: transposase [Geothrix sp.]|nr:transposase [Geothrix sp.]